MDQPLTLESVEVTTVACFLGCTPADGLVRTLNMLHARGAFQDCATYGDILLVYLEHELSEARRRAAKPGSHAWSRL